MLGDDASQGRLKFGVVEGVAGVGVDPSLRRDGETCREKAADSPDAALKVALVPSLFAPPLRVIAPVARRVRPCGMSRRVLRLRRR